MRILSLRLFLALFLTLSFPAIASADSGQINCSSENLCVIEVTDPSKYADFIVPIGVTELGVEISGASGGLSDNGQGSGNIGFLVGTIQVSPGNTVRLAVGSAGLAASQGGFGGTNSVGGFGGGGGGLGIDGAVSGGGGGAASVIFYLDQVFIAAGGGGGNGIYAGGGGGGGQSGGTGGLVSPEITESAKSGISRPENLASTSVPAQQGAPGRIKISYQIKETVFNEGEIDPRNPLNTPKAVADFAVVAIAAVSSLTALWAPPKEESDEIGGLSNVDLAETESVTYQKPGWGDRLKIWRLNFFTRNDHLVSDHIYKWASVSLLVTRLNLDGAHLRAIFGSLAGQLKYLALLFGVYTGLTSESIFQLEPINILILSSIGILDALSGSYGFFGLICALLLHISFSGVASLQYLAGLVLLGFAPILAGSAFRPFRRSIEAKSEHLRNRTGDIFLSTFFTIWVYQGLLSGLPVLARNEIAITAESRVMLSALFGALIVRLVLEEIAIRFYPVRLSRDHSLDLPEQSKPFSTLAMSFRTIVFTLVANSFIGNCWQLWVGVGLFMLPQLLNLIEFKFKVPLSLLRVIPRGLPGFVFAIFVGLLTAEILLRLMGESPEFAKNVFALAPIPMTLISIIRNRGFNSKFKSAQFKLIEDNPVAKYLSLIIIYLGALKLTGFI